MKDDTIVKPFPESSPAVREIAMVPLMTGRKKKSVTEGYKREEIEGTNTCIRRRAGGKAQSTCLERSGQGVWTEAEESEGLTEGTYAFPLRDRALKIGH